MSRSDPSEVERVACIGTGTIGSAWTAYFLRGGYRVKVWDPMDDADTRVRAAIEAVWPAVETLGLAPGASRDNLRVTNTLKDAVEGCEEQAGGKDLATLSSERDEFLIEVLRAKKGRGPG